MASPVAEHRTPRDGDLNWLDRTLESLGFAEGPAGKSTDQRTANRRRAMYLPIYRPDKVWA